MVRLLLIQPNYRSIYSYAGSKTATPIYPPLGLAYMAAVVREKGHDVKILEANAFDLNHEQIKEVILRYNPDFVAMTGASSMMDEIRELCSLVPDNIRIIFGGIHASSMPEEVLRNYPRINF